MQNSLKAKVNSELKKYLKEKIKEYGLIKFGNLLSDSLYEFVLRDGKRARPIFFLLAYLGFSKKPVLKKEIIRTALAFELLHDFLLIHDDIIDNSNTRRGKPTLHKVFELTLRQPEKLSKDLSIVAADMLYAIAIDAFLCIKTKQENKEKALKTFLGAAVLTGAGEYKDVINGITPMNKITLKDIRLNYIMKTAEYTFKAPLVCASILAGASLNQVKIMAKYAELMGEAFQIYDDLIGIFGSSEKIGKSVLSDIAEAKKTLPIYLAYKLAPSKKRKFIDSCLGNNKLRYQDLLKIRKIITECGAYSASRKKMALLLKKAEILLKNSKMKEKYKKALGQINQFPE